MTQTNHDSIPVQLWIQKHLPYPWNHREYYVAVVGQGRQFGSENPRLAKRLKFVGNDKWMKKFWVPANSTLKYKFVVIRACSGTPVHMENLYPRNVYIEQVPLVLEHIYNKKYVRKSEHSNMSTRNYHVQKNNGNDKETLATKEHVETESVTEQKSPPNPESVTNDCSEELKMPDNSKTKDAEMRRHSGYLRLSGKGVTVLAAGVALVSCLGLYMFTKK